MATISKGMLLAMPNYGEHAFKHMNVLSSSMADFYFRDRLLATCFIVPPLSDAACILKGSFHTLLKLRFGSVSNVISDLIPIEETLRLGWVLATRSRLVQVFNSIW